MLLQGSDRAKRVSDAARDGGALLQTAAGAYAVVYEAMDMHNSRKVALKARAWRVRPTWLDW